jgi:hypothetical protein
MLPFALHKRGKRRAGVQALAPERSRSTKASDLLMPNTNFRTEGCASCMHVSVLVHAGRRWGLRATPSMLRNLSIAAPR